MSAETFLQNQDYSYLSKFTKYDLVMFAELYHDSEKRKMLLRFIKWVIDQPSDVLKTNSKELIELFLKHEKAN
jgi:hypothetical protein